MSSRKFDFALAIGGEAGQGIATPGDILARVFVRRGLHLYTYNAYQSIIRGGQIPWQGCRRGSRCPVRPQHLSGGILNYRLDGLLKKRIFRLTCPNHSRYSTVHLNH